MEELQSWWEVPTIAHFCSLFRAAFSLLDFDIEELEEALLYNRTDEASPFLIDLLIRLLSGCYQRNDLTPENYEKYLKDFIKHRWIKEQGKENSLENDSFNTLSLRNKVELLHALCDARLDAPDVAEVLKNLEADSLRVEPLGKDEDNATYWYFYGTRLYKEIKITRQAGKNNKEKEKLKRKREKEKKRKRKEKRRKKTRGRKARGRKPDAAKRSSSSDSESEEEAPLQAPPPAGWRVVCSTEQEWQQLAGCFEKSKSRCERELHRTLTVDFLPEIGNMIAEKEKNMKRKLTEVVPRRSSQRIERLRQQREEEERLQAISMVEELEVDHSQGSSENKQGEPHQREDRIVERQIAREERAKRAQMREERAQLISEGKEVPARLQNPPSSFCRNRLNKMYTESNEDIYVGMYKVLNTMKTHRDSWPFLQPVDETFAPGYYDIVKQPIDLSAIEKKLQTKQYFSRSEFESDVTLMLDNCRKYNGIDSDYTKMSANIQSVFEKAMLRIFPADSSDDEEDEEKVKEEPPTVQTIGPPTLVKHSGIKAMEMLAQAAEQALQDASKRSVSGSFLKVANKQPITFCINSLNSKKIVTLSYKKDNSGSAMMKTTDRQAQVIYIQGQGKAPRSITGERGPESKASYSQSMTTANRTPTIKPAGQISSANVVENGRDGGGAPPVLDVHPGVSERNQSVSGTRAPPNKPKTSLEPPVLVAEVGNSNNKRPAMMTLMPSCVARPNSRSLPQQGAKNIILVSGNSNSLPNNSHIPGRTNFLVLQNPVASAVSQLGDSPGIATNVVKQPILYCQLQNKVRTGSAPAGQYNIVTTSSAGGSTQLAEKLHDNAMPVKKRAYVTAGENSSNSPLPVGLRPSDSQKSAEENRSSTDATFKTETSSFAKTEQVQVKDSNTVTCSTGVTEMVDGSLNSKQSVTSVQANRKSVISSYVVSSAEGLGGKLQVQNSAVLAETVSMPKNIAPTAGNFSDKLNAVSSAATVVSNQVEIKSRPNFTCITDASAKQTCLKLEPVQLQPKICVAQSGANVVLSNFATQSHPQQPAVQYSISFGQNSSDTSTSSTLTTQPAVSIASNEAYMAPVMRTTPVQLPVNVTEASKPQAVTQQVHYIDQAGIRLATMSPANLIPLTVKTEQAQSPQLFYVQHPGQMVIQQQVVHQQYQPTHNVHLMQPTVASQPGLTAPKTIIVPAVSQHAFLTPQQPQTIATQMQNGMAMHYYSVLPRHHLT